MAIVVDALINGKIKETILTNVVTANEKMNLAKKPAGFTGTTSKNIDRMAGKHNRPRNIAENRSFKAASAVIRQSSNKAISDLKEVSKGVYLSTVG